MKTSGTRRGFTLIELMVTIVLIGMVVGLAGSFIRFAFLSERKTEIEYGIQGEVRLAAEVLNKAIRNATVTFTIPQALFEGTKKAGWNYLGIEDNNKIVEYLFTGMTGTTPNFARRVLVESGNDVLYDLAFTKVNTTNGLPGTNKQVEYSLDCYLTGSESTKIGIKSQIAALNSLVVEDVGSAKFPSTAIAYRSDPTPQPYLEDLTKPVNIAITIVLDDSGSMDELMYDTASNSNRTKKSIMQEQGIKLVTYLSGIAGIDVCIIPFSTTATPNPNIQYSFISASGSTVVSGSPVSNKSILEGQITNINSGSGWTNTGDALRRSYYALEDNKNLAANAGKTITNYVILLTDGNPTAYSTVASGYHSASNGFLLGKGSGVNYNTLYYKTNDNNNGMDYVQEIGQAKIVGGNLGIKTFLIGFTANTGDITNANLIKESCNAEYFEARSPVALNETFSKITAKILSDTWHIYGPYN